LANPLDKLFPQQLWTIPWKNVLILLDISTIHIVFHKFVENYVRLSTGDAENFPFGRITKKSDVYSKTGMRICRLKPKKTGTDHARSVPVSVHVQGVG
jgi:hypothetical protein